MFSFVVQTDLSPQRWDFGIIDGIQSGTQCLKIKRR